MHPNNIIGQLNTKPILDNAIFPPSDTIKRFNAEEIKQKLNNSLLTHARRRKPPFKMSQVDLKLNTSHDNLEVELDNEVKDLEK